MRDDKPNHRRINNFHIEKRPSQISRSVNELAMLLKDNHNSVIVSDIVPRHDNVNNKANEVNNSLVLMSKEQKIIYHSDSIDRVNSSMRVSDI